MIYRDTATSYGVITRFLHNRLIAVLVLFELLFGAAITTFNFGNWKSQLFTLHKSLGIVIVVVGVVFLLWRLFNPKPNYSASMPFWERFLAHLVRCLLYLLIILMPLSGWAMSTAKGYIPNFFWLLRLPLPGVPLSEPLAKFFAQMHYISAWVLTGLLCLHIAAALKHHFIDKDTVLKRMWRP